MKCELGAYRRDLYLDVTLNKNKQTAFYFNFEVFGFLTVTNLSVHSYNFVSDFSKKSGVVMTFYVRENAKIDFH